MSVAAIHLTIHGRVQNIGYRSWLVKEASEHKLTGWVRNLPDATVEALLVGEVADVAHVHHLCERGPMNAHVTRVDASMWTGETPTGFEQLPTPAETPARSA